MTEKSVVDRLADLARCKTGRASVLGCVIGSSAWSTCVRARGHEGDCAMGLSEAERNKLAGKSGRWAGWLKSRAELRKKRRLAEEAWGT